LLAVGAVPSRTAVKPVAWRKHEPMKRRVTGNCSSIIIIGFSAAFVLAMAPTASLAAGVEVLPSQQAPELPASKRVPFAPQQEQTIPPRLPMGLGSNMREIPLPKVFRGCWGGSVPAVDTIRMLRPGEGPPIWLTKVYTLCYEQDVSSGRWKLTFADGSVERSDRVSDQRQVIKVKAVIAPGEVELSDYLHFRAAKFNALLGLPTGESTEMDEIADLHCRMTPDRDAIEVQASVFVESNADPYAEMTWHTRLERTSGAD
jgi:hypothetical protein